MGLSTFLTSFNGGETNFNAESLQAKIGDIFDNKPSNKVANKPPNKTANKTANKISSERPINKGGLRVRWCNKTVNKPPNKTANKIANKFGGLLGFL